MKLDFKNNKELFDYVRNYDKNKLDNNIKFFADSDLKFIKIDALLKKIFSRNTVIIDVRTENEYAETSLPNALNFPILSNSERHNTGLIYKKLSQTGAFELAKEYAEKKNNTIIKFLNHYKNKRIYIYCWRGGGRSKYFAYMAKRAGFDVTILEGGIKSYRRKVNDYFHCVPEFDLLELNGLTGCGKTEILNKINKKLPVINFEAAANHYSSLFGFVPYKIRGYKKVANQSAFENNLFAQILYNSYKYKKANLYLAESESKKVGDFFIPNNLYTKLNSGYSILIKSTIKKRIERLTQDYFINPDGYKEMLSIFRLKEKFFRKEMSSKYYDEALRALKNEDAQKFIEIMLLKYYDIKYFDKGKNPVAVIPSDHIKTCIQEIKYTYSAFSSDPKLPAKK